MMCPHHSAERARAQSAIDNAYWAFTRQARAKPPVLAVPWAYALRARMERERQCDACKPTEVAHA
jgi:hypothetical protein